MKNFRWFLERKRELYPMRGLGLFYRRGCLGSTYGEPGRDMFVEVQLLVLRWTFALHFVWKSDE